MKLKFILLENETKKKVIERREGKFLGIATSADAKRYRQKKVEECSKERTNCWEEDFEVERKQYESKISRKCWIGAPNIRNNRNSILIINFIQYFKSL